MMPATALALAPGAPLARAGHCEPSGHAEQAPHAELAGARLAASTGHTAQPRHFLRDDDLSPAEQAEVLDLAARLKAGRFAPGQPQPLAGPRTVAVLFDKPSLRTRVSFAAGVSELGGYPLLIDMQATHAGRGESAGDLARVLGRQVAAIAWRTFRQADIEELAAVSPVPVINTLTDEFHPCQVLADLQAIRAAAGRLSGVTLAFLGDGSGNMAHSYLLGGATAGLHVRICGPVGYPPDPAVLAAARAVAARTGGSAEFGSDPDAACRGADFLATDVWTSMGQEGQEAERAAAMEPFRLDEAKLALAGPGARALHCLPAHRGTEITAAVIDGPASLAWDQAENRLHAQKALLAWLLAHGPASTLPPGTVPPGTLPPGSLPPGAAPPGTGPARAGEEHP